MATKKGRRRVRRILYDRWKDDVMKILADIQLALKAPKGQYNSFGQYYYRNCEDILEAVKPLLGEAVLTLSDELIVLGGNNPITYSDTDNKNNPIVVPLGEQRFYVKATATITHEGESISVTACARESENKKGMDSAQLTGSCSSYARKYALDGLFLIDDTKDSDSTNTHGKENKPTNAPTEITEEPF